MSLDGRHFAAVIFDIDSTLVNSLPSLGRVWSQWMTEYGVTPDPSVNLNGMTTAGIVRLALPDGPFEEALARVEELEANDVADVTALPGAAKALTALPPERTAVATSGIRPVALARLAAAGLTSPPVMATADEVEHGKPAPDLFLLAAERLGVDPTDCLVAEDAPAGVAAARAAGMDVVAVLTSSTREELADADLVVPDLGHLVWQVTDEGVRVSER